MSEKHYKWKDVSKPSQRLNMMLNKKELPSKFAPSKDRSGSVDALFNHSREKTHSSMDMIALNQSKEEPEQERLALKSKELLTVDKKMSMMKLPTLSLAAQQSSFTDAKIQSSAVAELKKEFWAFKQNVLKELDRQKTIVQKFVKEIILTLEVELEKVRGQALVVSEDNGVKSMEETQAKSIQEWKNSLQKITLAPGPVPLASQQFKVNPLPKPSKSQETSQPTTLIPPRLPLDLASYLSSLSKLRRQLGEMDKLLQHAPSIKPLPMAKK